MGTRRCGFALSRRRRRRGEKHSMRSNDDEDGRRLNTSDE